MPHSCEWNGVSIGNGAAARKGSPRAYPAASAIASPIATSSRTGIAAPAAHETTTLQASQGAVTIIALDTLQFDQVEVPVAPGQEVVEVNAGNPQHSLVVDAWGVDTGLLDTGERVSFTMPADVTPGTSVEFRCTSPGHTEAGRDAHGRRRPRRPTARFRPRQRATPKRQVQGPRQSPTWAPSSPPP